MKNRVSIFFAGLAIGLGILLLKPEPAEAAFGGSSAHPPLGKNCTVQFRRGDALGSGANLPVPPRSASINGAETSISGTLKNLTPEWLVVDAAGTEFWIPKTSVLLLQF